MSTFEEHEAEQAAITARCEAGTCDHAECKPIRYACPACEDESIYIEATIYWDAGSQSWEIGGDSDPDDYTTAYCGSCGEEHYLHECRLNS